MRAAFDRVVDWYNGPGGLVMANMPARIVNYDQIFPLSAPGYYEVAWITFDAIVPAGISGSIFGPGVLQLDYTLYDQVAEFAGGPITHCAACPELVTPATGTPYYRCRLIPLPLPF